MALIIMAVYDTEENGRSEFTKKCLASLTQTVNFYNHRLVIVNNNSCKETSDLLISHSLIRNISVITLPENVGTARAINKGLALRRKGENIIKIDNDVIIHGTGWVEKMEEVIKRMPTIGILGLKRVDLMESPYAINTDQRSRLLEVPHQIGQRWYIVEECKQVMGTCTMINPLLLDKVGYFYQCGGLYGFDDSLLCVRSTVSGFINCFLHGIDIDHIDPGGTAYTDWKEKYAGEMLLKYAGEEAAYKNGLKSVYHEDK